jgi:hypothetical protein
MIPQNRQDALVPQPRGIFLNNHPTELAIEACRLGHLPRTHLRGARS